MPVRTKPASIKELAMERIVRGFINACFGINSANTKYTKTELISQARQLLRPFWGRNHLPFSIRREILAKCTDMLDELIEEGYLTCLAQSYAPAYLLNILLDTDIVDLRVHLCCYDECDHKTALLDVLATDYAKGLNSLELTRSRMSVFEPNLFKPIALSLSNNLTTLILRNICNDGILKIIGQSCFRLVTLDVSQSMYVTDTGMKDLLQCPPDDSNETGSRRTAMTFTNSDLRKFFSNDFAMFLPRRTRIDPELIQEDCKYPTKLCSTLQTLIVECTDVTYYGIVITLLSVLNLKSLGDFTHVGNAIELFKNYRMRSCELELTNVHSCSTTSNKLQAICDICTKLEKLIISDPRFSPSELFSLPKTLTKIYLRGIPANAEWLNYLHTFLMKPQLQILQELSLNFSFSDTSWSMDLGKFLFQLTKLEVLWIHGVKTTLKTNTLTAALGKLDKIYLNEIDHPDSLQCILKCAPNLTVLHVFTCLNLNNSNVVDLLNAGYNKMLKCFYINELPDGDIKTVLNIINVYPEINIIGNTENWNVESLEANVSSVLGNLNNYKLSFPGNYHWFSSQCFSRSLGIL